MENMKISRQITMANIRLNENFWVAKNLSRALFTTNPITGDSYQREGGGNGA